MSLLIPVPGDQVLEVPFDELPDDPRDLINVLGEPSGPASSWLFKWVRENNGLNYFAI